VVRDAFGAIGEYLEELVAGAAPQPVRLFPYYRALQELLGAERIHPADLLAIDTAHTPTCRAAAGGRAGLCGLPRAFEKSLLPYLKSPDAAAQRTHAGALAAAIAPLATLRTRMRAPGVALHAFARWSPKACWRATCM
jgi:chemosensory pili system protein ChpA (sensor histidine kinase/response regulator)